MDVGNVIGVSHCFRGSDHTLVLLISRLKIDISYSPAREHHQLNRIQSGHEENWTECGLNTSLINFLSFEYDLCLSLTMVLTLLALLSWLVDLKLEAKLPMPGVNRGVIPLVERLLPPLPLASILLVWLVRSCFLRRPPRSTRISSSQCLLWLFLLQMWRSLWLGFLAVREARKKLWDYRCPCSRLVLIGLGGVNWVCWKNLAGKLRYYQHSHSV